MTEARSTTTGASVRACTAVRSYSTRTTVRPVSKSAMKPCKRHRLLGFLVTMFALFVLANVTVRVLPTNLQELSLTPTVVSAMPWFTLPGLIALLPTIVSWRILAVLITVAAVACDGYW